MGDTAAGLLTIGVLFALLAATHAPLGGYRARVFTTDRHLRVERAVYRLCGADKLEPETSAPGTCSRNRGSATGSSSERSTPGHGR